MTKRQKEYYDYLNSQAWKDKRRAALDFYGRNCCLCGYRHNLQVHHRSYATVFKEDIKDLIVLCEPCHEKFHKLQDQARRHKRNERKQNRNKKKKDVWKNGKESKYMRNPDVDKNTVTYYPHRKKFEDTINNPSNVDLPF